MLQGGGRTGLVVVGAGLGELLEGELAVYGVEDAAGRVGGGMARLVLVEAMEVESGEEIDGDVEGGCDASAEEDSADEREGGNGARDRTHGGLHLPVS